jgi:hypothetical protein
MSQSCQMNNYRFREKEWYPTSEPPQWTGIYEVKFQKGRVHKRFYTGLPKSSWLPIGSKECVEDIEQPTHWRFLDD